ncbi:probable cytochrome P450 6d5 [Bradysia coprophila]|uniref:probable cytochrome P450 6d5 n=1 Tax=Bradysia coprophila TaxID=38358 RepID=UPI00187DA84A|nr:probable cytochrome P450 6d5 [Bradysia coprophila]
MFAVIVIITCCYLIYYLAQRRHNFWKNRGFAQLQPHFIFGDIQPMIKQKMSFGQVLESLYVKTKMHKLVGIYFLYKPVMLVNDPVLLQHVFIKNFTNFHDRPCNIDLDVDPIQDNLFNTPGKKWRDLRTKLSPTFTSGKLKGMFSIITDCGNVLDKYLVDNVNNGSDVFEFRDLFARFNTNIISSVAFGIDNDCINDPDHIFRKMGVKLFEMDWKKKLQASVAIFFPLLRKIVKFKFTHDDVEQFFDGVVKQTINYRAQNNYERNDFMQLLIQLKDQGFLSADKGETKWAEKEAGSQSGEMKKLTYEELLANAFLFFVAGFETSSSTLSFCIFELARNPRVQRKIQEEIDRVLAAHGNKGFTYEMVHELKYLECCIDEALRKYPIVPLLFRVANEDFRVPDTNLVVPKGTEMMIPVLGIQRNPDIYDNPLEYRPERFLDSSTGSTSETKGCYYLPFGDGPRNCIGMRLAKVTTKIGMATVLAKFNVELVDKSLENVELDIDPHQFIHTPLKPFNLRLTPRVVS